MKKVIIASLLLVLSVSCSPDLTEPKTNAEGWKFFKIKRLDGNKPLNCVSNGWTSSSNAFAFSCDWSAK